MSRIRVRATNVLRPVLLGGLLAAAIHNMDGVGGRPGWAWIFILEGLVTVVCAVASFFILSDFPDTAKFLNETERECYHNMSRYHADDVLSCAPGVWVVRKLQADMKYSAGGETFKMKYVWQCLTDRQTWLASEFLPLPRIKCIINKYYKVGIYMGL